MIPIIKNIIVTDETGKKLGPTYLKRAKGLVKNGRARWVNDEMICLTTCPPKSYLEDKKMDEDKRVDNEVFEYVKQQVDFLKQQLSVEIPLNMNSEFQPGAAADICKIKDNTNLQILALLNKLLDSQYEPGKKHYQDLLEKIVADKSIADNALAVLSDTDPETKRIVAIGIVEKYEATKQFIAEQIIKAMK